MPYDPPANLNDFDRSQFADQLKQIWHNDMSGRVNASLSDFPAFFDVFAPPGTIDDAVATPEWTGLPRTMKRRVHGDVIEAARLVEEPIAMGEVDPVAAVRLTSEFREVETGQVVTGPKYRPQDEYLEWVTRRDAAGRIAEVVFTAEGPEYWQRIALDRNLLIKLYREMISGSVDVNDLFFDRDVCYLNRNQGGPVCYRRGDYNPYNQWNMVGAVHLTQPANTLGAEIALAKDASLRYGDGAEVTIDPQLVACGGYGGINRMSDPTIGFIVNTAARGGKFVALRNPIGLYISHIEEDKFALQDGQDIRPITNIDDYFVPLRPSPDRVSDMIVRARFRVPAGVEVAGRQATVSDVTANGEPIQFGGQIADHIILRLFAHTAPGAPQQSLTDCAAKACPTPSNPNLITTVAPDQDCPPLEAPGPLLAEAVIMPPMPSGADPATRVRMRGFGRGGMS